MKEASEAMSLENAKKFAQTIEADKALGEQAAKLRLEELPAFAQKLGLDFTPEELKEALQEASDKKLTLDEMEEAAGGIPTKPCSVGPNGKHKWEKTGHKEVPHKFMFWDYSMGYDLLKCAYCGKTREKHT